MAAAYRADNEHGAWNTLYEMCAILTLFGACLYPTIETMAIDRIERRSASLCAHSGHHRAINVWSSRSLSIDSVCSIVSYVLSAPLLHEARLKKTNDGVYASANLCDKAPSRLKAQPSAGLQNE
ncbi:hypothetical protein HAP47_0034340 [Bradyrhizobium sp. 41S5]|uniref:hypothetical protein n=1 Tax=Bradyrhizobium sp. 41S5 TaxID=1404443 RepID=UPI00156AA278|nr:hypothetical protein [Bradyrhizobium sp. 41S5]UFX44187.1 hypothetical protein HAP47_0034340 [Bradyrhizobium sp. 41S5]